MQQNQITRSDKVSGTFSTPLKKFQANPFDYPIGDLKVYALENTREDITFFHQSVGRFHGMIRHNILSSGILTEYGLGPLTKDNLRPSVKIGVTERMIIGGILVEYTLPSNSTLKMLPIDIHSSYRSMDIEPRKSLFFKYTARKRQTFIKLCISINFLEPNMKLTYFDYLYLLDWTPYWLLDPSELLFDLKLEKYGTKVTSPVRPGMNRTYYKFDSESRAQKLIDFEVKFHVNTLPQDATTEDYLKQLRAHFDGMTIEEIYDPPTQQVGNNGRIPFTAPSRGKIEFGDIRPMSYQGGVADFFLGDAVDKIKQTLEEKIADISKGFETRGTKFVGAVNQVMDYTLGAVCIIGCSEVCYGLYTKDHALVSEGGKKIGVIGVVALVKKYATYQSFNLKDLYDMAVEQFMVVLSKFQPNLPTNPSEVRNWCKNITTFEKALGSISNLCTWFLENISGLAVWLYNKSLLPVSFFKRRMPTVALKVFIENTVEFLHAIDTGARTVGIETYEKINLLHANGLEFITTAVRSTPAYTFLSSLMKRLEMLKDQLINILPGLKGRRQEPATCLLRGGPGNAKTLVTGALLKCMEKWLVKTYPDKAGFTTYNRQSCTKYWDGAVPGIEALVLDDFGQTVDVPGDTDNEYSSFVGLVNTSPYMLHMADVASKGKVYFKGTLILGNTNVEEFRPNSIVSPYALNRRWHVDRVVYPKPEYCEDPTAARFSKKFDFNKLKTNSDGIKEIVHPSMLIFYNPVTQVEETYTQVVEAWIAKWELHHELFLRHAAQQIDINLEEIDARSDDSHTSLGTAEEYVKKPVPFEDDIVTAKDRIFIRELCTDCSVECDQENFNIIFSEIDHFKNLKDIDVRMEYFFKKYDAIHAQWKNHLLTNKPKQIIDLCKKFLEGLPTVQEVCTLRNMVTVLTPLMGLYMYITYKPKNNVPTETVYHDDMIEQSSNPKIKNIQRQTIAQMKANLNQVIDNQMVPQMGYATDPSGAALIESALKRNMYTFKGVNGTTYGFITGIKGYVAVMPKHFAIQLMERVKDGELSPEGSLTFMRQGNKLYIHSIMVKDFLTSVVNVDFPGRDICFIRVPDSWGLFKDISFNFKSERSLQKVYNEGALYAYDSSGIAMMERVPGILTQLERYPICGEYLDLVYHYDFKTMNGDCGAILIDHNPKIQKEKIIGIHTVGNSSGFGCSCPVTQEMINTAFGKLSSQDLSEKVSANVDYQSGIPARLSNIFEPVYVTDTFSGSATSSFIETPYPLHGLFGEPKLKPSNVSWKLIPDCVKNRNSTDFPAIDVEYVKRVAQGVCDVIFSQSKKAVPNRLYTHHDVLFGMPECDSPKMNRNTSAGWPFVRQKQGTKGKQRWLGSGELPDMECEGFKELIEIVERELSILKSGNRPVWPFMINLKDELRKIGKLSRAFGAGPLSCMFINYIYFGSFCAFLHNNCIINMSTLGIDVYSAEWEELVCWINNHYVLSGDFKGFDEKPHPGLIVFILIIIEKFYETSSTQEDRMIREILLRDIFNAFYYDDGIIYESFSSMPSGHLLTAIINTLLNILLQFLSFDKHIGHQIEIVDIPKYIKIVTNGDDSLVGVPEDLIDIHNEEAISITLGKEYGFTYTSDTKDGKFHRRELGEVGYLKRGFRWEPSLNRHVAPLSLERLLEFPNYTRKNDSMPILKDNLNKMLAELSLHGKPAFEQYGKPLQKAYEEVFHCKMDRTAWVDNLMFTTKNSMMSVVYQMGIDKCKGIKPGWMTRKEKSQLTLEQIKTIMQIKQLNNKRATGAGLKNMVDVSHEINILNDLKMRKIAHPKRKVGGKHSIFECHYQMNHEANNDTAVDTDFANAAVIVQERVPFSLRNKSMMDSVSGAIKTDIQRWLEKPVIIDSGSFAAADTATTFSLKKWYDPLDNTMMKEKIKATFSLRADLVLRLVCNGTPFQQGIYALCWLPSGGSYESTAAATNWCLMHKANRTHVTQLLHAKLDVNCDTEVIIRVPFVSCFNSFPYSATATGYGNPGYFFIYPLVPIAATGGSITAYYTLYANYENIELGTVGYPQMGKSSKKDLLAMEQEGSKPSDILQTGADIATALTTVPLLSAIAGPTSWALDTAAGVARFFGFSKPISTSEGHRVVRSFFPGMANNDSIDLSESLGMTIGNHVVLGPEYLGSEIDQLSKDFFIQKYAWTETITWATTDAKDTVLVTMNVDPGQYTTTTDSTATLRHYTPMGWFGDLFNLWRGDLKFRIHIAKTMFHSGRLLLSFEPFVDGVWTPGATTVDLSQYLLRTIIDVRNESIVEFTVPFVAIQPWILCGKVSGRLRIIVLDRLVAPANVTGSVSLFVERCGGANLEFASPKTSTLCPIVPSSYQMGGTSSYQMGGDECTLSVKNIGGTGETSFNEVFEVTQGEQFTSLRQMLKRACPVMATTVPMANTVRYVIPPFASSIYRCTGAAITGSSILCTQDLYTIMSCCFTQSRGGVRIRIVPVSGSTTTANMVGLDHVNNLADALLVYITQTAWTLNSWLFKCVNLGIGYATAMVPANGYFVPQNTSGINRCNPHNLIAGSDTLLYNKNMADPAQLMLYQLGTATAIPSIVLREGADDIGFGGFVSIPPLYVQTSPA